MCFVKGIGILLTAIVCFIDQRIASLLYHQFSHKLHIHKRCCGKFFFTTIIVLVQILFDKDCSLKKPLESKSVKNKISQTDNAQFDSLPFTDKTPSFNICSNKKSTPKPHLKKKRSTFSIPIETNNTQTQTRRKDNVDSIESFLPPIVHYQCNSETENDIEIFHSAKPCPDCC